MKMLKKEKKRGIALIMALWIMVALLVICASFVYMMRIEMRIAKDYSNGVKAHYLAKSGINHALALLRTDTVNNHPNYIKTDSLHEAWFTTFSGTSTPCDTSNPLGPDGIPGTSDDYPMSWTPVWFDLGSGGYTVDLRDEAGMAHIGAYQGGAKHLDSLEGMADIVGDDAKACRVRDYWDSDSVVISYGTTGSGYEGVGVKNKPFDTLREIQKVKDINTGSSGNPLAKHALDLTAHSQDYDTTLGGAQRININTATSAELDTLPGVGPATAANIIAARPYPTVGDIKNASGVGEVTQRKLADLITVDDPASVPATGKIYINGKIPGAININTAPYWSIFALWQVDGAKAAKIIKTRQGEVGENGNPPGESGYTYGIWEDSGYGRGEIVNTFGVGYAAFQGHSDQVTVRSDRFRIVSFGKVKNAAGTVVAQRKIEVVVDRHLHDGGGMGPFEILYWSETVPEFLD